MTIDAENVADITFILSEATRFEAMSASEVMAHIRQRREDFYATLQMPNGAIRFCGRAAYQRFEGIAERVLPSLRDAASDYDFDVFTRHLRHAFAELFLDKRLPVTVGSIAKMINRAKDFATRDLGATTHHMPCILFYEREPDFFSVGPVEFRTNDRFLSEQSEAIQLHWQEEHDAFEAGYRQRNPAHAPAVADEEARRYADMHVAGITGFYRTYGWVSSVAIPRCHASVSKGRADRTIDAALNVLRLFFFGTYSTERYRRADAPGIAVDIREFITENDRLTFVIRQGGRGAPAGKDWHRRLLRRHEELFRLAGAWIQHIPEGRKANDLRERYVDALHWYGDAVTDVNRGAQVVKFATALERLTMTRRLRKDIEETIKRRVALLNRDRDKMSGKQIASEIATVYECRSGLVHGSLSPHASAVENARQLAARLAQWSILSALQFFVVLESLGRTTRRELDAAYDEWYEGEQRLRGA